MILAAILNIATVYLLLLVACWGGGALVRAWRAGDAARQRRAGELAAARERTRIAGELHDVLTHHVTAMVMQADAAQIVVAQDAQRAAAGLAAIGDTGRHALSELRQLLDVLHSNVLSAPGEVRDLVELARRAGQPVELTVDGGPHPAPGAVELAAYRVVQEGLTNALKHAPGRRTVVNVRYGSTDIDVRVVTHGPPAVEAGGSAQAAGHGLAGLRERVGTAGGELSAMYRPGGGFVLRARLPIGERAITARPG